MVQKSHNCLNSTMVRLKLMTFLIENGVKPKSQFHYGSIKTHDYGGYASDGIKVSIPLWFD